jgi:hypothetical protein
MINLENYTIIEHTTDVSYVLIHLLQLRGPNDFQYTW